MITTLKETWVSVRNLEYGQQIVKKTVGQAFWYWFKYVLAISIILMVIALASLTYFTPQLPKFAETMLPDISITIKDGQLTSTAPQPYVAGDANFTFILNTNGKVEDAAKLKVGVLVLSDRAIVKNDTETRVFNFSDIKDNFTVTKNGVTNWLKDSKSTLLLVGLVIILIGTILTLGTYLISKWIGFLIGALLLLAMGKIIHRSVNFADTLKLAIYAAVPSLVVSLLLTFVPNQSNSVISLGVWVFFACAWLVKLPLEKK